MELTICKLAPEHAEAYARFFDETPHDDGVDEGKCYCVCWCRADSEWVDFSSREKRRALALKFVGEGQIQGYLAYCGDRIIGWCNANTKSDCLKCVSWRTFMSEIPTGESDPGVKVKSIFCFTITPDMKRQGIATRLLERVCEDAARDGFDFVEAYPNKTYAELNGFAGPAEMYRRCGFSIVHETEQKYVVRKQLK